MTQNPDSPVEFKKDDDDGLADPIVPSLVALALAAAAVLLAVTDLWATQVEGYTGRRRAGFVNLVESLGQTTWIAILGAAAVLAAIVAIRRWIAISRARNS